MIDESIIRSLARTTHLTDDSVPEAANELLETLTAEEMVWVDNNNRMFFCQSYRKRYETLSLEDAVKISKIIQVALGM